MACAKEREGGIPVSLVIVLFAQFQHFFGYKLLHIVIPSSSQWALVALEERKKERNRSLKKLEQRTSHNTPTFKKK